MRSLRSLIIAAIAVTAPGAAYAADLITVPVSTNESVPVADAGPDWNGFYAGVYGVTRASAVGGVQYGLGLDIGVNAQFEFVLVGAEVDFHGLVGGVGATSYLQGIGKFGVAVTDNVILYAAGGAGIDMGAPVETDALLGGGVELALTDDLSVDARYLHGFAITGANPKDQLTVGANFHF
jgi:outer membrane immunogenic protein